MEQISIHQLTQWLKEKLAGLLDLPIHAIQEKEKFSTYGLTSSKATLLASELKQLVDKDLLPTVFYAYPTVEQLADFLTDKKSENKRTSTRSTTAQPYEPIAIIGMACRFPQSDNIKEFWQLLVNEQSAVSSIPASRWNIDEYYDPDPTAAGKTNSRYGAFIDNIDDFDPFFFDISPREAMEMSPNQKLTLEIVWEALTDAKIPAMKLQESKTGVFMGNVWNDFDHIRIKKHAPITQHSAIGQSSNIIANRVSYAFGFRGPSIVVDSACSSSLLAVHLACQSLRDGDSDIAIAGGINIMQDPDIYVALTKFGALSPDGRCFTFDERANGYVRGEGVGVVILKTLAKARKDGDKIYAVIRGSAVNNDGYSNGLTAPNLKAQKEVLEVACERAGFSPEQIHYVEAHGTGTKLGDPIEAEALGSVLGKNRPKNKPLMIGSVKTNIGHLEGAAGIAGLIKVVLAIQHRTIPRSLNFDSANPFISLDSLNLKVPATTLPWKVSRHDTLKAGVSAFGWGGTNAHVVLEEYPDNSPELFVVSGDHEAEVLDSIRQVKEFIQDKTRTISLKDLCAEFATLHANKTHRVAFKVNSSQELDANLSEVLTTPNSKYYSVIDHNATRKLVFICSPFGGQYPGMARTLMEHKNIFKDKFNQIDELFYKLSGWSLADKLYSEDEEDYNRVDVAQPLVFAIQVALAEQYRYWGIIPDMVVGHSLGEIAAACISGLLSTEDAVLVAYHYSRLQHTTARTGGMGLVQYPVEIITTLLDDYPNLQIAGYNSMQTTIVAGDNGELDKLIKEVSNRGGKAFRINVEVAAHTPYMSGFMPELEAVLHEIKPMNPAIPMFSTTLNRILGYEDMRPKYWCENLGKPVLFAQVLEQLLDQDYNTFVELSPHPVLRYAINQTIAYKKEGDATVLYALERDKNDVLACLNLLYLLYLQGFNINWSHLYSKYVKPQISSESQLPEEEEAFILPMSAKTEYSLKEYARAYAEFLKDHTEDTVKALYDFCATAALKKSHYDYRFAFSGKTRHALISQIEEYLNDDFARIHSNKLKSGKKIAFIFPGQGAQWLGMGRDLFIREEIFRQTIEECDRAFSKYVDWSLIEELNRGESESRFDDISIIQPLICAVQIGIARLWMSWGIRPHSVAGHSMGEVAAAHIAGVLSIDDTAHIICTRSRLLKKTTGKGAMAITELSFSEAEKLIAPYPGKLSVAVNNSSKSTVIAGEITAIEEIVTQLDRKGVFCRIIRAAVASHCPQVEEILDELFDNLQGITPHQPTLAVYSTARNQVVEGTAMNESYWIDNVRNMVQFAGTMEKLARDNHSIFVEISPHPALSVAIRDCLEHHHVTESAIIASTKRNQPEQEEMLRSLAELYCHGAQIEWENLYQWATRFVELPHYPWHRERYELEDNTDEYSVYSLKRNDGTLGHPLLGQYVQIADEEEVNIWETRIDLNSFPFLKEHQVYENYVFPVAAYIEMLEAAIEELYGRSSYAGQQVSFKKKLVIDETHSPIIQLKIKISASGDSSFQFFWANSKDHSSKRRNWELLAEGVIEPEADRIDSGNSVSIRSLIKEASVTIGKEEYYKFLGRFGFVYGEQYQCVEKIWKKGGKVVGKVVPSEVIQKAQERYKLHPTLVDSCFRMLMLLLPKEMLEDADKYMYFIESVAKVNIVDSVEYKSPLCVECELTERPAASGKGIKGNFTLYDNDGNIIVKALGICINRKERSMQPLHELIYEIEWRKKELAELLPASPVETAPGNWLLFSNGSTAGKKLQEQLEAGGNQVITVAPSFSYKARRKGGKLQSFQLNPTHSEDFNRLCSELFAEIGELKGMAYLWSMEEEQDEDLSADVLETTQNMNCLTLVHFVQAMHRAGKTATFKIITSATQDIALEQPVLNLAQAPLWGLVRVLSNEHPEFNCQLIDLSLAPTEAELSALALLVGSDRTEQEIALRGELLYVPRLVHLKEENRTIAPLANISSAGTYLITEGSNGMGWAFAQWLGDKGAHHLVILYDQNNEEVASEILSNTQDMDDTIHILKTDFGDEEQLREIINRIEREVAPIRGVVHAMNIRDDGMLLDLDAQNYYAPAAPKINAGWNLHKLTLHKNLDFFIMVSSVSSVLGTRGLTSQVMANAFVDALAHHRQMNKLPSKSYNWGQLESPKPIASNLRLTETHPMSLAAYVNLFESGLYIKDCQLVVSGFTPEEETLKRPLFSELNLQPGKAEAPRNLSFKEQLQAQTDAEAQLGLLEDHLKEKVSEITKSPASKISSGAEFKSLGLDSLMTVQLGKNLSKSLDINLAVTTFWTYPTIRQFASFLQTRIELASPQLTGVQEVPEQQHREEPVTVSSPVVLPQAEMTVSIEEEVKQLSFDDVNNQLDEELKNLMID